MQKTEMVKRLEATAFEGDLLVLLKAEDECKSLMEQYKGYAALSTAFMRFFLETIIACSRDIQPRLTATASWQYALLLQRLVHGFQTLRAAEVAAQNGYPMQGFTLLRNIHDDCVLVSAAMQGLTNFEELAGSKSGEAFDRVSMRKRRMAAERKVRLKMDGAESGLSAETLKWLRTLDEMYDWETHGGRLSSSQNFGWLKGEAPLPFTPTFTEATAALFINRFLEVAWLVHRLVPFVQLPGLALSKGWGDRWRVVDECFHHLVDSLARDLDKPVFTAVCDFVLKKFPFDERSLFPI